MNKRPLLISFAFITLCLLPVMILRDFTPDNELRYLQIADEAIENGNVFAFTLQGEAYADKPPLYLWIVILGKLLFGKIQGLPGLLVILQVVSQNADLRSRNRRKAPAGSKRILQADRGDKTAVTLAVSGGIDASEVK